jgi:hypothetical protein
LGDEIDNLVGNLLESLQLSQARLRPGSLAREDILVQLQVELLLQEGFGVLVDEIIHLGLLLKDAAGAL